MSESSPAVALGSILAWLRRRPSVLWRLEAKFKGVRFLGRSEFLGRPIISVAAGSELVLGDGLCCYSARRANPLACFQPCVLRTMLSGAKLTLGKDVGLSGTVLCAAVSITVGEGTIFGSGALVVDNDFHFPSGDWGWNPDPAACAATAKPVNIGRGVFVGARAIILKGVTIGDRAVIGAGAVVTRDVPARHLAAGNPAGVFPPKTTAHPP
jgi:acetyltransferase-like isoleucine patch superfamily enzyme